LFRMDGLLGIRRDRPPSRRSGEGGERGSGWLLVPPTANCLLKLDHRSVRFK
jgi:hypothetical protein